MCYHKATFQRMDPAELELYGQGLNSWDTVDSFARILSGPAWLKGQVPDSLIQEWTRSEDFWWRRAALVSTVALNTRSQGGRGGITRTLAVCRLLVNDHEDMVDKAMSWALRELVVHDPEALNAFLEENETALSARVKREVWNKLTTGLKNPSKKVDYS
jgi:3-methyladenine DNA glycosylase AlkD